MPFFESIDVPRGNVNINRFSPQPKSAIIYQTQYKTFNKKENLYLFEHGLTVHSAKFRFKFTQKTHVNSTAHT